MQAPPQSFLPRIVIPSLQNSPTSRGLEPPAFKKFDYSRFNGSRSSSYAMNTFSDACSYVQRTMVTPSVNRVNYQFSPVRPQFNLAQSNSPSQRVFHSVLRPMRQAQSTLRSAMKIERTEFEDLHRSCPIELTRRADQDTSFVSDSETDISRELDTSQNSSDSRTTRLALPRIEDRSSSAWLSDEVHLFSFEDDESKKSILKKGSKAKYSQNSSNSSSTLCLSSRESSYSTTKTSSLPSAGKTKRVRFLADSY